MAIKTVLSTLHNQHGLGLTKVILFIALFSIIIYGFTDSLVNLKKRTTQQTNKEKRFLANTNLKRLLLSDFAISLSSYASENKELSYCALGFSDASCPDGKCCQHNKTFSIHLIDPSINLKTNDEKQRLEWVKAAPRITGSQATPILYTAQGSANCTENCAYSAYTLATPHCPGEEPTCLHAEHIKVDLHLVANNDSKSFMRDSVTSLIYPVQRNYPPTILNAIPYELMRGTSQTFSISVDSGHPSEKQTYSFVKCEIENTTLAQVACGGFTNNMGFFTIQGIAVGATTITLQVSDGQMENDKSKAVTVNVVVK